MSIFGHPPDMPVAIKAQMREAWPSTFGKLSLTALWKEHNTVLIHLQEVDQFWDDTLDMLKKSSSVEEFDANMKSSKNIKQERLGESLKASGRKVSLRAEEGLPLSSRAGRAVHRAANSGSLSSLTNVVLGTANQWETVEGEVVENDAVVTQSNRRQDGSDTELPLTQVDPSRAFVSSSDSSDSEGNESDENDDGSVRQTPELSTGLPPDVEQSRTGDGLAGGVLNDGSAGSHDFLAFHDGAVSAPGQTASCSTGEQTAFTQGGGAREENSLKPTCSTSKIRQGGGQSNSAVQATSAPNRTLSPIAKPGGRRRRLSDADDTDDSERYLDSHANKRARM